MDRWTLIADSLCCTAETDPTLQSSYTPIEINERKPSDHSMKKKKMNEHILSFLLERVICYGGEFFSALSEMPGNTISNVTAMSSSGHCKLTWLYLRGRPGLPTRTPAPSLELRSDSSEHDTLSFGTGALRKNSRRPHTRTHMPGPHIRTRAHRQPQLPVGNECAGVFLHLTRGNGPRGQRRCRPSARRGDAP